MATQSPPPDAPTPDSAAPAEAQPEAPADTGGLYEYVDATPRTYQFDGAPPQSAELGDVCPLPRDPGDGRWTPSKRKAATRLPDNHPQEAAVTSVAQTLGLTRREALAEAAKQDAAASGKA
jgi:hypothetical protein